MEPEVQPGLGPPLGIRPLSAEVAQTEVAYYLTKQNPFGLPLDNRKAYTKSDWLLWTATLVDSRRDFDTLVAPLDRFINESPSRVPFTDWYDTVTGRQTGFQARSVIGGVYVKMLSDAALWKKWAGRANSREVLR